jgi:hypothetical protein
MLIFIRNGETSRDIIDNNNNLSNIGYLRSIHLAKFFNNKKIQFINQPKRIITPNCLNNNDICYNTVRFIGTELNIPIETDYTDNQIANIADILKKDYKNDILICWKQIELTQIIENLIYKLYYKKVKLHWNKNPLFNYDNNNDYSSMWIIDTNEHKLKVYNLFDINYNKKYDYFDIDYKNIKNEPVFILSLDTGISLFDKLYGMIDNLVS